MNTYDETLVCQHMVLSGYQLVRHHAYLFVLHATGHTRQSHASNRCNGFATFVMQAINALVRDGA